MRLRRRKHRGARRARETVRAAIVYVRTQQVVVVDVEPRVVADPLEAQVILRALELASGRTIVLHATQPCGCRDLFGLLEHIDAIDRMPPAALVWQELDVAMPITPASTPRGQPN